MRSTGWIVILTILTCWYSHSHSIVYEAVDECHYNLAHQLHANFGISILAHIQTELSVTQIYSLMYLNQLLMD